MRHLLAAMVVVAVLATSGVSAQAPAPSAEATRTTWYFYTVKWGFQNEFLDLFQRNHYPILKAQLDAGVYTRVRTLVPENHGDGRADWTFAVELVRAAKPPGVRRGRRAAEAVSGPGEVQEAKSSGASSCSSRTGTCR